MSVFAKWPHYQKWSFKTAQLTEIYQKEKQTYLQLPTNSQWTGTKLNKQKTLEISDLIKQLNHIDSVSQHHY